MGLHKRGRVWWVSYMVAGRQHRESSHSSNKRVAKNLLAIRRAQVLEGRLQLPQSKPPRFEDWAQQFVLSIRHPNTKRRYVCSVEKLKALFKGVRLSQIDPGSIERFKEKRLSLGIRSATVNRDLAVLRRMLKLAKRQRLIAHSPFNEVEFLEERKERRQPHILTYEEETKLMAVTGPMLRALIILLVETGLRVGKEALPLKWTDIDLERGSIYVCESKTMAGRRLLPLSSHCKAELLRWRGLTGPAFSQFVFSHPSNPTMHLLKLPKTWARALRNAKIEYFPIGNLRHTFASRLQEAGASPVTLAQILGHSSTGIIQTYAKVLDEFRRDAIKKLEEYRYSKVADTTIPASPSAHVN